MTKIKVSRLSVRAIGLVIGALWLATCLILLVGVLDTLRVWDARIYGLIYPLLLVSCVVVIFVGRATLSKLLSFLVYSHEPPRAFYSNLDSDKFYAAGQPAVVIVVSVVVVGAMTAAASVVLATGVSDAVQHLHQDPTRATYQNYSVELKL